MAEADFSGVLNPRRVIDKRMQAAEGAAPAASAATVPQGTMSQADFGGKPLTKEQQIARQKALAEALRRRK